MISSGGPRKVIVGSAMFNMDHEYPGLESRLRELAGLVVLHWQPTLHEGVAFAEVFGERVGYRHDPAEDAGIFWSSDAQTPVLQMVKALGLEPKPQELEEARVRQASPFYISTGRPVRALS